MESGLRAAFFHLSVPVTLNVIAFFSTLLFTLAWLIPNHYLPWASFYNDSAAALGMALLALSHGRKIAAYASPNVVWLVAGIALIPPLQWITGLLRYSGDAFVSSAYVLGLSASIAIGYASAVDDAKGIARTLSTAALIAGLCSVALVTNQALEVGRWGIWLQEVRGGERPFANLGQPNNLGTLLGVSALGLLLLREHNVCRPGFAAAGFLVLLVGTAAAQSRTSFLFAPLVAAGLFISHRRGLDFQTKPSTVLIAWAIQCCLALAWPKLQSLCFLTPDLGVVQRGVETPRYAMWSMLWEAVQLKPWVGYGWLQVSAAELAVVNDHAPIHEMWMQAHNMFLDLTIWCGLPMGGLISAGIIWWVVTRATRINTIEATVGFLVILVALTHSMLEFPYQYAYFLLPVGVWVGQIEAASGAKASIAARWSACVPVAAMVLVACLWRDYFAIEEDARLVRFERLRIGNLHAAQLAPDAPFLSSLTSLLRFMRTRPQENMSELQLEESEAIVRRYPYPISLAQLAEMHVLNGRLDAAVRGYQHLRHMYPPQIYELFQQDLHERALDEPRLRALDQALPLPRALGASP